MKGYISREWIAAVRNIHSIDSYAVEPSQYNLDFFFLSLFQNEALESDVIQLMLL